MAEVYKGVTITIQPGNLRTNECGWFILSWPGHEQERIQSAYKQAQYIFIQAKEFVDTWLEDGYITVNAENSGTPDDSTAAGHDKGLPQMGDAHRDVSHEPLL